MYVYSASACYNSYCCARVAAAGVQRPTRISEPDRGHVKNVVALVVVMVASRLHLSQATKGDCGCKIPIPIPIPGFSGGVVIARVIQTEL
jgi:hypothetical protein